MDLHFEETYPHPIERVWLAVTDSAAIAEWLMPNTFKPVVGHEFQFHTNPAPGFDGKVHCRVLAIEEPTRMSFTWRGGPIDTVVTITLEPVPGGTRLLLDHAGFEGPAAINVASMLENGWKSKILKIGLPQVLAKLAAASSS